MLRGNIDLEAVLDLKPEDVPEFCDNVLDGRSIADDAYEGLKLTQKGLCQYLGIDESTLGEWSKEKHFPMMAKEAYVLMVVILKLQQEINRMKKASEDFRILWNGNSYQICVFTEDEDGEVIGKIVADRIESIEHARMMSSSIIMLRLLQESQELLTYFAQDVSVNEEYILDVKNHYNRIKEIQLFVNEYEKWKSVYGKKTLDDLLNGTDLDK